VPVTVIPKTGVNAAGLPAAQLVDVEGVFDTAFAGTATETTRAEAAEALLAPKASPTFTGTVTIPTGATIAGFATTASVSTAVATETTRAEAAEALLRAAAAGTYTFNQASPLAVWVINHSLGRFPSATVVDSSGNMVEGDVVYNSSNQVTLSFGVAFSGVAYLN
jgi:hypothetical protein